jgi:hypothetical protein
MSRSACPRVPRLCRLFGRVVRQFGYGPQTPFVRRSSELSC